MTEKKIPTILGILLVLGLMSSLTLLKSGTGFFSKAAKETSPQEVKITNITDSSFVVSWYTEKQTAGFIEIKNLDQETFFDVRDQPGNLNKFDTHYVVVKNLNPETKYQFTINSGGRVYYEEGQKEYSVQTAGLVPGEPPKATLASGRVVTLEDEPAGGAVVYIQISDISPLSALVTDKGNWVVSLAQAYSEDLVARANYQEGKIVENINVQGGAMGEAAATVFTQNDDPVPEIKLGGNYDFTDQKDSLDVGEDLSPPPSDSKLKTDDLRLEKEKPFRIINPEDGETITIPQPEIFGEGPRGGKVEITLESEIKYEAEIDIGGGGEWSWTPPQSLSPGTHTLRVDYSDPDTGEKETFLRTFVLSASDEDSGPAFSSTPSGTTATPTPTLTATPQPTNTPQPTSTSQPTKTPAPTTPPRKSQPSTDSGVPDSGFWEPTFILLGGSLLVFLSLAVGF